MGGKRGPLIAGAGVAVAVVLVALILVLPRLGQVKDANDRLTQAATQESTLNSQLAALKQAQRDAPKNRETIRKVEQAIPPTVDQQGFVLLLQNAAVQAGVDLFTISPSTPAFDPATGISTITNGLTVTGTYFAITEFIFSIETLPRASQVTSITLGAGSGTEELTLQASVNTYTSDSSAGPGSTPGPSEGSGGTSAATVPPAASPTPAAVTTQGA